VGGYLTNILINKILQLFAEIVTLAGIAGIQVTGM
jgi:hypothetical protein